MSFTLFLVGGGGESFESNLCFLGIRELFLFLLVIYKIPGFENEGEGSVASSDWQQRSFTVICICDSIFNLFKTSLDWEARVILVGHPIVISFQV